MARTNSNDSTKDMSVPWDLKSVHVFSGQLNDGKVIVSDYSSALFHHHPLTMLTYQFSASSAITLFPRLICSK